MNWWSFLQTVLLLVIGAAISWGSSWFTDRRRSREETGRVNAALKREDALRKESQEREDTQRRWEVGRDHAMAAISKLRDLQREFDANNGTLERYVVDREKIDRIIVDIDLVPEPTIRKNAGVTLRLLESEDMYWPTNVRGAWSNQVMILMLLIQNLTEFARREEVDHEWLNDLTRITEEWWTSGPYH
jgi:hypothetical protein